MALEECRECGKEVSSKARACPHCGFPMNEKTGEEPTTTQLTSKRIKTHEAYAGGISWLGIVLLFMGWDWPYGIGKYLGGFVIVAGLLYSLWAKSEKWWHHD